MGPVPANYFEYTMENTENQAVEAHTALSTDMLEELDNMLEDLRTREDEIPQWEFCDGFLAAVVCTRREIPVAEWLPMLLGDGETLEVAEGQPLLGICLGCQILLEHSEENDVRTLGMVPGRCVRFPDHMKEEDGSPAPVPHMGWNSLDVVRPGRLLHGIEPGAEFYFVHSYYVEPAPELVMATTVYGKEFCSVYGRDGLWAVQCHLEKSGRPGLTVLRNFYDYCDEVRHA